MTGPRTFAARLAAMAVRGLLLLACLAAMAALAEHLGRPADGDARLRVALFINGTLGDKSFFDAAARGVRQAQASLPVRARVVEGGTDPTRWQAALADLADSGEHDVIIAGTFTMAPAIESLAQRYPALRFIVFDASVDYGRCACPNVYSMRFRQNEGAYLAGYLSTRLLQEGAPGIPAGAGLGVVGGLQLPVIEDFILGYRAGAQAADPGIALQVQYANAFSDPAAGKEIARLQFARGAGIVFHAAGATGQGVNEAAEEAGRYAIGVDMDQAALYRERQPGRAAAIVTSVMKEVDVGLVRALGLALDGKLAYGRLESIGLAEGGVRLAQGASVIDALPPPVRQQLDLQLAAQQAAIVAGRVRVPSAFGNVP
jgi:basic membrane protein A